MLASKEQIAAQNRARAPNSLQTTSISGLTPGSRSNGSHIDKPVLPFSQPDMGRSPRTQQYGDRSPTPSSHRYPPEFRIGSASPVHHREWTVESRKQLPGHPSYIDAGSART